MNPNFNPNESNSNVNMPIDPSVNNIPNINNIVNSASIPQNIQASYPSYQNYQPQNFNPALQIRTPDQQVQLINPFQFSMMTPEQYQMFMQHAL